MASFFVHFFQGERPPVSAPDLISLKDEYRNMAGSVLPQTNDPMPNINTNKQGWGTDAAGTDLTEGDKYKDLINVKGAKFLDLYNSSSVKIDDADDLKDALKEYDVEMSIAFNDNPDNDEFRKAYIVVITGLTKKDGGDKPTPTVGNIKLSTAAAKKATLTSGTLDTLSSNGKTTASFSFDVAEWAAPKDAGGDVTVKWTLYVDGNKWSSDSDTNTDYAAGGPATNQMMSDNANQGKITKYTANALEILSGASGDERVVGKKLELVIDDIIYNAVRVQYKDANGKDFVGVAANMDEFVDVGSGKTIKTQNIADTNKYSVTNAKIDITGATTASDEEIKDVSITAANGTTYKVLGTDYVTVTVKGLTTASEKLDATSVVYDSGKKSMLNGTDTTVAEIMNAQKVDGKTDWAGADTVKVDVVTKTDGDSVTITAGDQGYGVLTENNWYAGKVTLAGADTSAYKVTLKATIGGTVVATKTQIVAGTGGNFETDPFKATGNVEFDVAIEEIKAPEVTNVKYVGDNTGGILTFDVTAPLDVSAGYAETTWLDLTGMATAAVNRDGKPAFDVTVDEDGKTTHVTIALTEETGGTVLATGNIVFKAGAKTTKEYGAIAMTGKGVTLTVSGTTVTPAAKNS